MDKSNESAHTAPEKLPYAYSFQCELTQDQLQDQLNKIGPWNWIGGDSEYNGLYLRARPESGAKLRILGEVPPSYTIEVFVSCSLAKVITPEELHKSVLNELLPSVGGTKVVPLIL